MSLARDQSLTIVVTGKHDAVMIARREVLNRLQTQVSRTGCYQPLTPDSPDIRD